MVCLTVFEKSFRRSFDETLAVIKRHSIRRKRRKFFLFSITRRINLECLLIATKFPRTNLLQLFQCSLPIDVFLFHRILQGIDRSLDVLPTIVIYRIEIDLKSINKVDNVRSTTSTRAVFFYSENLLPLRIDYEYSITYSINVHLFFFSSPLCIILYKFSDISCNASFIVLLVIYLGYR